MTLLDMALALYAVAAALYVAAPTPEHNTIRLRALALVAELRAGARD